MREDVALVLGERLGLRLRNGRPCVFHHLEDQPLTGIVRPLLSHHLIVDPTKLAQLTAVVISPGHHVAPWSHCACPAARNPQLAHSVVLSPMASIWNKLFTGVATAPPAETMSAGAASSMWSAPTFVVLNSATLPKPLTKLATSITPTVPAASAVDAMTSKSNLGPAASLSLTAWGSAAMITAVLPALWGASAANRLPTSVSIAAVPPPAVGVSGAAPANNPGGLELSPGSADNICRSSARPVASPSVWRRGEGEENLSSVFPRARAVPMSLHSLY